VVSVSEKENTMAPMITIETATRANNRPHTLSGNRDEWSSGAESAYRHVLGELNAWSRSHDSPRCLNAWIAEEAVRRSW